MLHAFAVSAAAAKAESVGKSIGHISRSLFRFTQFCSFHSIALTVRSIRGPDAVPSVDSSRWPP